jgi:hypothetical protein
MPFGYKQLMATSRPTGASRKRKSLWPKGWLDVLRYVLPAVVVLGGLIVMAQGDENHLEGGAGIVSAGLAIYFVNWLFRAGVSGDREREAEEAARDYFERHGRWPDG